MGGRGDWKGAGLKILFLLYFSLMGFSLMRKFIKNCKFHQKRLDNFSKMGFRFVNRIVFIRKIKGAVKKFI